MTYVLDAVAIFAQVDAIFWSQGLLSHIMKFGAVAGLIVADAASLDWQEYKVAFAKTYNGAEDDVRQDIFAAKTAAIEDQNAKYEAGESGWFAAQNVFPDWSDEIVSSNRGLYLSGVF